MSDMNFADYIARERERLHVEREQIFNQRHDLEQKLAAINNEQRVDGPNEGNQVHRQDGKYRAVG